MGQDRTFSFLIFFAYFLLLFFFSKDGAKVLLFFDMSDHKIVGGYSTLLAKVNKK